MSIVGRRHSVLICSRPMLTIVIPTRDTRELTLECLASLADGGIPAWHTIVVDDGSHDDTAAAVRRRHPQVEVLRNPAPTGFSRAVNRGLREAAGELVLLLNSDTRVEPGSLGRLAAAFRNEPDLGIGGARLVYPDGRHQWCHGREPDLLWFFLLGSGWSRRPWRWRWYRRLRRRYDRADARRPTGWVAGAALAVRRAVIEGIGGLDEDFVVYAQDLDLCARARQAGWRVAFLPGVRVIHHHGMSVGAAHGPALDRLNPVLLWADLLRWAVKRHGPAWAGRAALALRTGAYLRLLGLWAASRCEPEQAGTLGRQGDLLRRALAEARPSRTDPQSGPDVPA